jgi:hypothetical protein
MLNTARFDFNYFIYDPKKKTVIKKIIVCGSWIAGLDILKNKYPKYYEIYDHYPSFKNQDDCAREFNENENGNW